MRKETNKLFWVWKVGGGRIEGHFLQFFEFCNCSLCYGFVNFKLLGYFPNRGYFKSSVHTGMSKEEAVFSKP